MSKTQFTKGGRKPTVHPFDREHGVDTSGLIPGRKLAVGHRNDAHNTAYYGIAPSLFRRLIGRWQRTERPWRLTKYSFIDVGAGKGRAVLLASEKAFHEVVGIELHPRLAQVARANVERWQAAGYTRRKIRISCEDATRFEFPPGPCVVYLFNPFAAPILRRLVKHIEKSFARRPKELDLLYVNAEHDRVLANHPGFARLWSDSIAMSDEEAAIDSKIIQNDSRGEYGSTGDEFCSAYRWTGLRKKC